MITDGATYAYLCDVYVLEEYQGRGLGTWMMRELVTHPALQGLRRFGLVTRDAHGLYEKFGFERLANPSGHMEIARPGIYRGQLALNPRRDGYPPSAASAPHNSAQTPPDREAF